MKQEELQSWVTLARIVRPQGRHGEVLAELLTDFPELLTSSASLSLIAADGTRRPVEVEHQWLPTGRSQGRIVLKLRGTDSISAAEPLRACQVQMPDSERVPLEDETYYVSDLVGCEIRDSGQVLGTVSDVHFPVTADGRRLMDSAPLFLVTRHVGDEVLIPFATAFVEQIDVDAKRIVMRLPAGLVDVND